MDTTGEGSVRVEPFESIVRWEYRRVRYVSVRSEIQVPPV